MQVNSHYQNEPAPLEQSYSVAFQHAIKRLARQEIKHLQYIF